MIVTPHARLKELGVNVWHPFHVGKWPPMDPMIVETPVQIRGGDLWVNEVGVFSYFGENKSSFQSVAKIGRCCAIGPDVVTGLAEHPTSTLSPHPMFTWRFDDSWEQTRCLYEDDDFFTNLHIKVENSIRNGQIEIGNDVWIGYDVYIARGVKIGDGAVIAARSVVVKDVPPYTVVGGVPARPIKQRFADHQIERLLELKWWDYGPAILKNVDITDIDATIYAIEERIAAGMPKYESDKIEFNAEENKIYLITGGERIPIDL